MLENADELRDMVADPAAAAAVRDLPAEALSRSVGSSLYGSLNPSLVFSPADLEGLGAALAPELEPRARAESLTLLQTALAEMTTLDEALRKVVPARGGFDATFVGMTEETAELACRRLQARNTDCAVVTP